MNVTFLGTSAAWPSARHNNVCFVAHASSADVLFECGPSILHQLAVAGIEPAGIRTIIVSHIHGDHSLGLPMFLIAAEIAGRKAPITICLPESAVESAKQLCLTVYPSLGKMIDSLVEWIPLPEMGSATIGLPEGITATTARGIHPVPVVSTAVDFARDGRTLAFSGDTAYCEEIARNAASIDLLVHESNWSVNLRTPTGHGHCTATEAAGVATLANAKQLALVHTSRELAGHGAELAAEAAGHYQRDVFVPDDYDVLVI